MTNCGRELFGWKMQLAVILPNNTILDVSKGAGTNRFMRSMSRLIAGGVGITFNNTVIPTAGGCGLYKNDSTPSNTPSNT